MPNEQEKLSGGLKVALLIVLIAFFYFFSVTFFPMTTPGNEHSKTIVAYLLGSVLGTFMGYYWGNSSKNKQPEEKKPEEPK